MFRPLSFAIASLFTALGALAEPMAVESHLVRYAVSADGQNAALAGLPDSQNLLATPAWACASIQKGGQNYPASQVSRQGDYWRLAFGTSGVQVLLRPRAEKDFLTVEVASLSGEGVEALTFLNIPVVQEGPLAACAMALNLKTNVPELPGPMKTLTAIAYRQFGFEGAKVAIVVVAPDRLRQALKEVALSSEDIPRSLLGGPWAVEAPINRGSYLIDADGKLGEETADAWIALARNMGVGQLDFHTGKTMRFGDLAPCPKSYPHGFDGVRAVVDKMHGAGLQAGLHTYAFFIAKDSEWVSPKPDTRLAAARRFTLAGAVDAAVDTIPLAEPPTGLSPITGFQVRNSDTVRIGDELLTFSGVRTEPPFALTGCKRGAWGTTAAAHDVNARVDHLKECFGLFVPDGDSDLFAEVAARTAEVCNRCGFDMVYLDALDGSDIIAGGENAWYYAAKFVFELNRRLARPALFEMSTFTHHLWYARSRMGAWDVPARAFQQYVDIHALANEECARMFMPAHLGWWGAFGWSAVQPERTFPEDMEYLCGKGIGWDSGLSFLVGFTPDDWARSSNIRRLGGIVRQYETLRLSGRVSESARAALRARGTAHTLVTDGDRPVKLRQTRRDRHVAAGEDNAAWTVENPFAAQTPRIRIEALASADVQQSPKALTLAAFSGDDTLTVTKTRAGVTATIGPAPEKAPEGQPCAALEATNTGGNPESAWALAGRTFPSLMDLNNRALGLWVCGDGQGEVLNIQLKNPAHINSAFADHYIPIDFTGWRYCLLVEPESDRIGQYGWPYSARQDLTAGKPLPFGEVLLDYNLWMDYGHVAELNALLNNLPEGRTCRCVLGPIMALPLKSAEVVNPAISINGADVAFPVSLKSGQYLECTSATDCALYDENGDQLQSVTLSENVPTLAAGTNSMVFTRDAVPADEPAPRARVTVITLGEERALE